VREESFWRYYASSEYLSKHKSIISSQTSLRLVVAFQLVLQVCEPVVRADELSFASSK